MLAEDCSVFTDILSVYICILSVQIYFFKLNLLKFVWKFFRPTFFWCKDQQWFIGRLLIPKFIETNQGFSTWNFLNHIFYFFLFLYFRYYLKHTVLEHAFDQLCEAGFRFENIECLNLIFVFGKILKSLWFI